MFFPECARLAREEPAFDKLIGTIDVLLHSTGTSGVLNPRDMATALNEKESRITGVLSSLSGMGLLANDDYIVCPHCGALEDSDAFCKAVVDGDMFDCSQCLAVIREEDAEQITVYRLVVSKAHAATSNGSKADAKAHGSNSSNDVEVCIQNIAATNAKQVRVCLVQIHYSLQAITSGFGYRLSTEEQGGVKSKILSAIKVASAERTNILCLPELCLEPGWVNEIRDAAGTDMVVVAGSYYESAANICPILIDGQSYLVQKVNPSPDTEGVVAKGRGMVRGTRIWVYQTKYGRFAVLLCLDFIRESARLGYFEPLKENGVDFIVNPCYNSDTANFHQQANQTCQTPPGFPYVLQVNATEVNGKPGCSCIIGMEHDAALKRLEVERFRPEADPIRYKLLEADGEMMMIATLDIETKGVPIPARSLKIKDVSRYSFGGDRWDRL